MLRPVVDPRPPAHLWRPPPLGAARSEGATGCGQPRHLRSAAAPRDTALALRGGSEIGGWSASLARAMIQVLLGQRPISQLTRWLDDQAMAELALRRRQAARTGGHPGQPALLRSIRVQPLTASVFEVCAHLIIGQTSVAMAFRLERVCQRWLCTALELGPLPAAGLASTR